MWYLVPVSPVTIDISALDLGTKTFKCGILMLVHTGQLFPLPSDLSQSLFLLLHELICIGRAQINLHNHQLMCGSLKLFACLLYSFKVNDVI